MALDEGYMALFSSADIEILPFHGSLQCLQHIDYYTCFISYSSHDQRFVENLYRDLRKAGVLCWYTPESLNAGEKFPAEITEAVQSREKLIVVLSKYSLGAIFGSSAHLRDAMCPQ